MAGKRISGPQKRAGSRGQRQASRGLRIVDRDGYWHIAGTLRIKGNSVRVRRGTGLVSTEDNREAADALAVDKAKELRDEIVFGIKPSKPVSIAAHLYLTAPRTRPLNARSVNIVRDIDRRFGPRHLTSIVESEWTAFVAERTAGRALTTRERYLNGVMGFLGWCARKPRQWLTALPYFERDAKARNPRSRSRRRVAELDAPLRDLLIEEAPIHFRAQLAVEWDTGQRVSALLHGTRLCDLIVAPGRSSITYHRTKNGEPVTAALSDWAAGILEDYLTWRGRLHDREGALFLTDRKRPYSDQQGRWGGQNKRAMRATRFRVARRLRREAALQALALRRQGDKEAAREIYRLASARAALAMRITQHWLRHNFATRMLAAGADLRSTMDQGGWIDPRSVMGYAHDVPDHRRRMVEAAMHPDTTAAAGTNLTRAETPAAQPIVKKG